MQIRNAIISALAALTASLTGAQAAVIITATEVGSDVVFEAAGSLDLTGMSLDFVGLAGIAGNTIFPEPPGGVVAPVVNINDGTSVDLYSGFTSTPSSYGAGPSSSADFGSGSFSLQAGTANANVRVPTGYVSGDLLSAMMVFLNSSFASLGLAEGTYVWHLPNDMITLEIGGDAVIPLPAPFALFLTGLAGIAAARRRKA